MQQDGVMSVGELNIPPDFQFVEENVAVEGPTCTICSDCCMCETGGV